MGNGALDSDVEKTPKGCFLSDWSHESDPLLYGIQEVGLRRQRKGDENEEEENTDFGDTCSPVCHGKSKDSDDKGEFSSSEREEEEESGGIKSKKLIDCGVRIFRSRVNFPNGEYRGDVKEIVKKGISRKLCHGRGTFNYIGGCQYIGDFVENKRHGKGVFRYENGAIYEGDWENNTPSGIGKYIYPNGMYYFGGFKHGIYEGKGRLYSVVGNVSRKTILGRTAENGGLRRRRYPIRNLNNVVDYKLQYEGEFSQNAKNGVGVYHYSTDSVYYGEFYRDKRHGIGWILFPNADEWFGWFHNGGKDDGFVRRMLVELDITTSEYIKIVEKKKFRISMLNEYGLDDSKFEEFLESVFKKNTSHLERVKNYFEKFRERITRIMDLRRGGVYNSDHNSEIISKKKDQKTNKNKKVFQYKVIQD